MFYPFWGFLKVPGGSWMLQDVSGSPWRVLEVIEGFWMFLEFHGWIGCSWNLGVFWMFLEVPGASGSGCSWMFLEVSGGSRRFLEILEVPGGSRRFLEVRGGSWRFLYDQRRRFQMSRPISKETTLEHL